jgi:hypothetical protein
VINLRRRAMLHGQICRIELLIVVAVVFFQSLHVSAAQPKFYNLEDIPETSIGGDKYWDEVWKPTKTETISSLEGGRYDCRNKGPMYVWSDKLEEIKGKLEIYLGWLNKMYIGQDEKKVSNYREKYNQAVENGRPSEEQQAAFENWQDAQQSRDHYIKRAQDETSNRLNMLKQKRETTSSAISRACEGGGLARCPRGQTWNKDVGRCQGPPDERRCDRGLWICP